MEYYIVDIFANEIAQVFTNLKIIKYTFMIGGGREKGKITKKRSKFFFMWVFYILVFS